MNKKYKKLLKETMILTSADYISNLIKLRIYKNEKIFDTKHLKIEFRNGETDELIHTIELYSNKTINDELN